MKRCPLLNERRYCRQIHLEASTVSFVTSPADSSEETLPSVGWTAVLQANEPWSSVSLCLCAPRLAAGGHSSLEHSLSAELSLDSSLACRDWSVAVGLLSRSLYSSLHVAADGYSPSLSQPTSSRGLLRLSLRLPQDGVLYLLLWPRCSRWILSLSPLCYSMALRFDCNYTGLKKWPRFILMSFDDFNFHKKSADTVKTAT